MPITPYTDHLGNHFKSITEMCRFYNISDKLVRNRIRMGWSVKKALTEPRVESSQAVKCTDHLGNVFSSQKEKCRFWKISTDVYANRIRNGWSEKDALTKPIDTTRTKKTIVDHTGKKYNSYTEMCKHWNIDYETFLPRINSGMSMKEALETPVGYKTIVHDHLGNVFNTRFEMCDFWKIKPHTYEYRKNAGYDLKKALATETFKPDERAGIYTIIEQLSLDYYLVRIGNTDPFVCHITRLLIEYHNQKDRQQIIMNATGK